MILRYGEGTAELNLGGHLVVTLAGSLAAGEEASERLAGLRDIWRQSVQVSECRSL